LPFHYLFHIFVLSLFDRFSLLLCHTFVRCVFSFFLLARTLILSPPPSVMEAAVMMTLGYRSTSEVMKRIVRPLPDLPGDPTAYTFYSDPLPLAMLLDPPLDLSSTAPADIPGVLFPQLARNEWSALLITTPEVVALTWTRPPSLFTKRKVRFILGASCTRQVKLMPTTLPGPGNDAISRPCRSVYLHDYA
jgi:hypothetical protein